VLWSVLLHEGARTVSASPPNREGRYLFKIDFNYRQSIGRVKAFFGNLWNDAASAGLTFKLTVTTACVKQLKRQFLNARYIAQWPNQRLRQAFRSAAMHEVVFTDKRQTRKGVHTLDIASALIDTASTR